MKPESQDEERSFNRAGLLQLAGLAAVLALSTWVLVSFLLPPGLPEDFPKLPDVQSMGPRLREMLTGADKDARRHPGSAESVGKLGMVYQANQYPEQAAGAYRIAARLAPGDYRWVYCQSTLAEESGNEKAEFDLLQRTVRLKHDYAPALLKLADGFFKQDTLGEAAHEYELAARSPGGEAALQAGFGQARIAARREDWSQVIAYAGPLVRSYPSVRPPYQLLEKAYEALGQADKANEVRDAILSGKFTDVPPPKDAIHDQLTDLSYSSTRLLKEAGVESRFGHQDRAIQVAHRAADADPGDPDIHNFIARTLLTFYGEKPEAVDEALTQLGECLRLKPDDLTPLWGFANDFFEKPKPGGSVERLRALLRPQAGRADSHFYLGLAADAQGETPEAVAEYRAAIQNDPKNSGAFNKLGLVLDKAGKFDESISYLQKSVQLDPMNTVARFNLGVVLMQRGNYGQGLQQLGEVLKLKPHDPATNFCMGFAYLFSQKTDLAAAKFREGLRYKPDDPEAHYGLGSALSMQHQRDDAVKELREAVRLRPNYPEARELLHRLDH
ncbi:MAG TPA: tetratricopeptide repeat protein [Bryobacteraceae bacterium]|nr:tetratricopeptide repeat protein [Bryobacteraceae bacterium]